MFFLTFLNIYDVDVTLRSIKGSMAVFGFNSTSKKHIKDMQQESWTYVIVHAAPKIENLLFFLYNLYFLYRLILHDFIYVSLFQSKGQNSLSESDEYSSYKLINYCCSVKYKINQSPNMKTSVF